MGEGRRHRFEEEWYTVVTGGGDRRVVLSLRLPPSASH